jgi:DNA-binding NtrC family response regulator
MKWRVLLVEDEFEEFQRIRGAIHGALAEVLSGTFFVHLVQMNEKTLNLLCTHRFHLAIVDYRLGAQALENFLRDIQSRCPDVPVIFIMDWKDPCLDEVDFNRKRTALLQRAEIDLACLAKEIKRVTER